jgi:recombination protein RecA
VNDFYDSLDPSLKKLVKKGSDFSVQKQPTPSLGLNNALRGGLAYGRQVLIWGSKSAGKSSLCLQMVGMAQREGRSCAWIDSENSFDPAWATKLGVDTDNLLITSAKKVNDVVDTGQKLIKSHLDLMVIDSISALMPAVYFDKDGLKDLADTKQMGAEARDLTQAIKMLNYVNENTLIILISQQRKALGSMYVKNIPTGGEAIKFFSSTIIKLFSSESENNAITQKVKTGDRVLEQIVGREVNWTIEANKLGPAFQSGKYRFMFDGPELGVDYCDELVTAADGAGILEKAGTWFTVLGEKFQGRESVINGVRANNDLRERIEKELGL